MRARRSGGDAAHAGNAAAAAATAAVDLGFVRERDAAARRPSRRVVDVAEAAGRAFDELAADEVRDDGERGAGGASSWTERQKLR